MKLYREEKQFNNRIFVENNASANQHENGSKIPE
jgi:hypothetical protein